MKLRNKIINISLFAIISIFTVSCDKTEAEFEAPNKNNVANGNAEKIKADGTAMNVLKKAEKMAKIWAEDAVVMNINGIDLDSNGNTKVGNNGSKWIISYSSSKKSPGENGYTITFSGSGYSSWLQSNAQGNLKDNIANFSIDSDKAFKTANESGLNSSSIYSADLSKNDKGLIWTVGAKKDPKDSKYEVKKVDAISGQEIK